MGDGFLGHAPRQQFCFLKIRPYVDTPGSFCGGKMDKLSLNNDETNFKYQAF